jgi:hypothetical protein
MPPRKNKKTAALKEAAEAAYQARLEQDRQAIMAEYQTLIKQYETRISTLERQVRDQVQIKQDINHAVQEMEDMHKQEIRQIQSLVAQRDKTIGELEKKIELLQMHNMLQQQTININNAREKMDKAK